MWSDKNCESWWDIFLGGSSKELFSGLPRIFYVKHLNTGYLQEWYILSLGIWASVLRLLWLAIVLCDCQHPQITMYFQNAYASSCRNTWEQRHLLFLKLWHLELEVVCVCFLKIKLTTCTKCIKTATKTWLQRITSREDQQISCNNRYNCSQSVFA